MSQKFITKINELKKIKQGDYIFTCSMYPLIFDKWEDDKYDYFITTGGRHCSARHCSITLISEEYYNWFLNNRIYELYNSETDGYVFEGPYEEKVRDRCKLDGIEFEGI